MPYFKPNQVKSFKQDIAPIGFYFDIFSTPLFQIPILPIPLRIDKIFHGEPTLLISPNLKKIERTCKKLKLCINFSQFYKTGIRNLLNYARSKQLLIFKKKIEDIDIIRKWWEGSNKIATDNPDLVESFTFITTQFLKTYSLINKQNTTPILDNNDYINRLIEYCDSIIIYFRTKIEKNLYFSKTGSKFNLEKLYIERRKKYFPIQVKIPINDVISNETYDMEFVPYLIYDDLLESFCYNKSLLMNTTNIPINLKVYEDNKIINKTSTIDDIRINSSKIALNKLTIEEVFDIY